MGSLRGVGSAESCDSVNVTDRARRVRYEGGEKNVVMLEEKEVVRDRLA